MNDCRLMFLTVFFTLTALSCQKYETVSVACPNDIKGSWVSSCYLSTNSGYTFDNMEYFSIDSTGWRNTRNTYSSFDSSCSGQIFSQYQTSGTYSFPLNPAVTSFTSTDRLTQTGTIAATKADFLMQTFLPSVPSGWTLPMTYYTIYALDTATCTMRLGDEKFNAAKDAMSDAGRPDTIWTGAGSVIFTKQ